jgi:hypothetical protein
MKRKGPPSVPDSSGTKGRYSRMERGNAVFASLLAGNQETEEPEVPCNAVTSEVAKSARQSPFSPSLQDEFRTRPNLRGPLIPWVRVGPWESVIPFLDVATPGRNGAMC